MNNATLGYKIKEARLAKKMTQSEVVGDFITRNMLSQIESGTAIPSIRTLEYIAKVLDIPLNKLISDDSSDNYRPEEDDLDLYLQGKSFMVSDNYADAVHALEKRFVPENPFYDEISSLLAKCYYHLAEEEFQNESYKPALIYANKAADMAGKGLFENRSIKTSALLLLDSITDKL